MILEGNEIEKSFDGEAGKVVLDVTDKGEVKFSSTYNKDLGGYAKVSVSAAMETSILHIAEQIAAKTSTPWDDAAVKGLKSILGIKE